MATIKTSIMINDLMSQQFRAMNMAMSTVIDSFYTLQDATSQAVNISALEIAQRELQQIESQLVQFEDEIRQAAMAQSDFNNELREGTSAANGLLGKIGAIASAYLSFQSAKGIVNLSDEMMSIDARLQLLIDDKPISNSVENMRQMIDNINNQIMLSAELDSSQVQQELKAIEEKLVTVDVQTNSADLAQLSNQLSQIQTSIGFDVSINGMSHLEQVQQRIFESSQRTFTSYRNTADMVSKLGMQAGNAFASVDEIIAFSEQINKTFAIAGTHAQGVESVMLQLTQAMAAGRLQGEELNAILDNAQPIVANIQSYLEEIMKIDASNIKQLASEGVITAEIIKNAMFYAAEETNKAFESMPVTWSKIWIVMQDRAIQALDPVLQKINDIANSERIEGFMNRATASMMTFATVALYALDMMSSVGSFIYDNWNLIAPIVGTATAAIGAYGGALLVARVAEIATIAVTGAKTLAIGLMTAQSWAAVQATMGLTAAQWGLNAAMMANPIFIVVLAVIALIGVLYLAVAAVNYFTGESYSATGLIAGFFATLGAFIANVFMGLLEIILGVIEAQYNQWAAFANFFGNVFNDPIASIIHLFGALADNVLGVIEKIASAIDFVFGANLASTVAAWRSELSGMVNWAAEKYGNGKYEVLFEKLDMDQVMADLGFNLQRFEYSSAWNAGYDWGANLLNFEFDQQGVSGAIDDAIKQAMSGMDGIMNALNAGNIAGADTARNTGKLADSVDLLEEDLKYLRDAANRDATDRFVSSNVIHVNVKNDNHINSELDIDGIVDSIVDKTEEALSSLPEGV